MKPLTPGKLRKLRGIQYSFTALNSLAFSLLSGSIVTLYALRLGASGTAVGALNAFGFMTFFFMPLGRRFIERRRIIDVFGWGWIARYILMLPVLATPFLAARGRQDIALWLVLAGTAGFNVFRGIGLIGNNPVLALLGGNEDRGAFLSNLQIINSLVSIATYLAVAFALGRSANPALYTAFFGAGIVLGILGALLLFRLPEPEEYRPSGGSTLPAAVADAFRSPSVRDFFLVFSLISFAAGAVRTFLIVYARAVYSSGDNDVMVYTLAASLGSVAMGVLTRKLMDRIGAKPLYGIFTAAAALSVLPVILSPALQSPVPVFIFLVVVNFVSGFGLAGEENAAQTYYFALIPANKTLDLAIVYYLVFGLAGALGSALGGVALDGMASLGLTPVESYRTLFAALFALLFLALLRVPVLVRLGSSSIRESLGILFSLRDLRAIGLLERLDKSIRPEQEIQLIYEIGESGRPIAQRELLPYLHSPRLDVRTEALLALESLRFLRKETLQALTDEIRAHPFTTAYLAARILGKHIAPEALPVLREALSSDDYLLQGEAMVALARMEDLESLQAIEEIVAAAVNPRVIVKGAYALEMFRKPSSVLALVEVLRRESTPGFAQDEVVLSLAAVLGVFEEFYPLYGEWVENPEKGTAMLQDLLDDRTVRNKKAVEDRENAVRDMLQEPPRGARAAGVFLRSTALDASSAAVLAEAAVDTTLCGHKGFRFLLAVLAVLA